MKSKFFQNNNRPLIFGHRGVQTDHQENTMAGFQKAIALGLDGIELDTFLTKDGKLVVFHDLDTKRLTGVSGKITEMTWAEIQTLRIQNTLEIGQKQHNYPRLEAIPRLENVLQETRDQLLVNIEIKAPISGFKQLQAGISVANLIKQMKLENNVFVTSFNPWSLVGLKLTHSPIECGLIYAPVAVKNQFSQTIMLPNFAKKILNFNLISLNTKLFNQQTIKQLHDQGLAVGAWTIFSQKNLLNKDQEIQAELELIENLTQQKIDFLITDDVRKLKHFLDQTRFR